MLQRVHSVVPAQHWPGRYLGEQTATSMPQLFAVGETGTAVCTGQTQMRLEATLSSGESCICKKRQQILSRKQWCLEKEQAV